MLIGGDNMVANDEAVCIVFVVTDENMP